MFSMDRESCICLMEISTKVNLKMVNLVERDISNGHINQDWIIKENSIMENFMEQALYKIWMEFFKVNLKKGFYMEK